MQSKSSKQLSSLYCPHCHKQLKSWELDFNGNLWCGSCHHVITVKKTPKLDVNKVIMRTLLAMHKELATVKAELINIKTTLTAVEGK